MFSDMAFMMSNRLATPTAPAVCAANALRAWARRDEAAFRGELARSMELCAGPEPGENNEQMELLHAVAESLGKAPLGSVSEPMVDVCIDLLVHLAGETAACAPNVHG
jgi:hypothetical protein